MDNDPFDPARLARHDQEKVFAEQRKRATDDFIRREHTGAGRGGILGFLIVVGLILLGAWLLFRG